MFFRNRRRMNAEYVTESCLDTQAVPNRSPGTTVRRRYRSSQVYIPDLLKPIHRFLKKRVSHAFWLILNWNRTEARLSWSSFSYCFIWCHRNSVNNSLSIHSEENILSSNFYLFMICLTTLSVEESVLLRPYAVSTIKYNVSFKRR